LRIGTKARVLSRPFQSAINSTCARGHLHGYRQKSAFPEPRKRVTKHTRRAEARLAEIQILLWDYQVLELRHEPEPALVQVRVTVPLVSFRIVNLLPDFDEAEIV
jgi:hypothetical protein